MNYRKVNLLPGQTMLGDCQKCQRPLRDVPGDVWADLDGRPFVDYFHAACLTIEERSKDE